MTIAVALAAALLAAAPAMGTGTEAAASPTPTPAASPVTTPTAGIVPTPSPGAEEILGFAEDLFAHGDPYRAEQEYARFLYVCGTCQRAAYAARRMADASRAQGQFDKAAAREREVAERFPGTLEARDAAAAIGGDLELAGRLGPASDAYRAFAAGHPDDPRAAEEAELAVRTALRAHDPSRVASAVPLATGTRPELPGLTSAVSASHARHRSPAVAGVLAAVLPGAGHAYAGEWKNAFASFATNALFAGGAVLAAQKKEWAVAGVVGGAELFWYGGNVVGAVNAADRFNTRAEDVRWRNLERHWLAPKTPVSLLSVSFEF